MKLPRAILFLGLLPLLVSPLSAQQDPDPAPLSADVAAMVDGVAISRAEYQDYLYQRFGKRPLNQMIDLRLVQAAAERYGIQVAAVEVDAVLSERLEQTHQGRSEEQFAITLSDSGMSLAMFEGNMRRDVLQELTLNALVRTTRVATDLRMHKAFEARYGVGGIKVEVRHILVMPHFLRANRIKAGANVRDIDNEQMKAEAQRLAEECHQRLDAGEDFIALVAEYSHDQVSLRNDGLLPTYRPGLYGVAFTEAVASLEEGAYSEVLGSGAGQHIVLLESRQTTQMVDVREALVEEVMTAAPTWQEREEVLASLRTAAEIQLW